MTTERAIQILEMNEQEKWRCGVAAEEEKEAFNMAIEALKSHDGLCDNLAWYINERHRLLKEKPQWIPVKERLPEKYRACIVTCENGDVFKYAYINSTICNGKWVCCGNEIIAWMPLPEPYKEEGGAERNEQTTIEGNESRETIL